MVRIAKVWVMWGCVGMSLAALGTASRLPAKSDPKHAGIPRAPIRSVPETARVMGLQMGVHTIGELERRLGPGLAVTGAHPQGARLWRHRQTGWFLYADGFEYRPGRLRSGPIIEVLGLSQETPFPERVRAMPVVSIPASKFRLPGGIAIGMTRPQVYQRLKREGPAVPLPKDGLVWRRQGFVRLGPHRVYRTWTVDLRFRQGKVCAIFLSVD